jgi:uncharacterized protein
MSDRIEQARCDRGVPTSETGLLSTESLRSPTMTNPAADMPCPVCTVPLVMSERQGVEIDYCPQCRGVWLDRGELDKIVERGSRDEPTVLPPQRQAPTPAYGEHWTSRDDHDRPAHPDGHHGKRRKSFFEELFD